MSGGDRITITQEQLRAAMLVWETAHRAGSLRTRAETAALPAEQVAAEGAAYLFGLLNRAPTERVPS